jgi:hypothetical protein
MINKLKVIPKNWSKEIIFSERIDELDSVPDIAGIISFIICENLFG